MRICAAIALIEHHHDTKGRTSFRPFVRTASTPCLRRAFASGRVCRRLATGSARRIAYAWTIVASLPITA